MVNYLNELQNKTVLVTGGLGFVGNSLVRSLVNDLQCKVIVVDNCLNSSPAVLKDVMDKIEFHQESVLETEKLFPLMDRAEYIFHLACVQIAASGKQPILDLQVNAQSTLQMLEYLRYNRKPLLKRFIYTSSGSVYGSSTRLPLKEDSPTNVLSNYAATKLLGENYTIIYGKNYGLPVASLRYSNVYGFGQSPNNPYCGVMGRFIHNALVNLPLSVIGDGEQTRDYTFITDAVRATEIIAVHPQALCEVFNIGTNVETSVNDLVDIIKTYVPEVQVEYLPERDIDNIRRRSLDIEMIHQRLQWTPKVTVKSGIRQTLDWYRNYLQETK
jgi:UDP-glucose 4-epimerase